MHTPFEALITSKSFLITMTMLALAPEIPAQQAVAPPPNAPATVAWDAIHVTTNAPCTLEVDAGFAARVFVIREAGSKTFTISIR